MNHKRRRPKIQRAACFCGGKASKKFGRPVYGTRGSELRLREKVKDA